MIHPPGDSLLQVNVTQYRLFLLHMANALCNLNSCPKLSCNKVQSLVIGNTNASRMIHLPGIFIVGKDQHNPICVLGSFFAAKGKMLIKFVITVQILSINMSISSVIERQK